MESKEQAAREYAEKHGGGEYGLCARSFKAGAEWQAHNLPGVEDCIERAKSNFREEFLIDKQPQYIFTADQLRQLLNFAQRR